MRDIGYKVYGGCHRCLKVALGRLPFKRQFDLVNVGIGEIDKFLQERVLRWPPGVLAPTENVLPLGKSESLWKSSLKRSKEVKCFGVCQDDAPLVWMGFVDRSAIPEGYSYSGLHYGGYIHGRETGWCLPSWIWTNAAIVRFLTSIDLKRAMKIGQKLLDLQLEEGGWFVRFDYSESGAIPVLAPNDSAYIANHAMLQLYAATEDVKWLNSAEKCADWIIASARQDAMVWTGYNLEKNIWDKDKIIVDVGFTLGFFVKLYEQTQKTEYRNFAERFARTFIKLFYNPREQLFATSLDKYDRQQGGYFARGQAWALEGLMPFFKLTQDLQVRRVIEAVAERLVQLQKPAGGWSYNFSKPFLGVDCKGTPVLAKALCDYNSLGIHKVPKSCVEKALQWCLKNTSSLGESKGGIFRYSMEGAIVHSLYSETALVYSSIYALEVLKYYSHEG